jgi:hypothetical protein
MNTTLSLLRAVIGEILSEGVKKKQFDCPDATQDVKLNLENRQKAIESQKYGPANPSLKNQKFWLHKSKMWDDIPVSDAKTMLCGNCAAFDRSPAMLKCIRDGIGDKGHDAYDTVEAGTLGYCHMLKFKCAAARTCDAWITKEKVKTKQ